MATSVVMPALEMAQDSGRLLAWRKREGEAVRKGEPLMEIETDKAVVEVEAEADGILAGVRAREGDVVPVGRTIAWIVAPGEAVPTTETPTAATATEPPAPDGLPTPRPAATGGPPSADRPLVSPRARRLAAELGVDLGRVAADSRSGPVTAADVMAAAPSPRGGTSETTWRLMAERVTATWTSVPQFAVSREVDATALVAWRRELVAAAGAGEPSAITYSDLLIAIVARVLRAHPRLNASWLDGRVVSRDRVNIGLATAAEHGLVVPVLHDADRLPLREIARRRRDLVERARANRLRPADLADGTFTISNLGSYGVHAFTAIVNAPQAGILAVGEIRDCPAVRDGLVVVRPQMALTLTCDHRVVDGARAGLFLRDLGNRLERVERDAHELS